jgi:enamine deaminase RidA (YjgF/YER057c/UK114 family)
MQREHVSTGTEWESRVGYSRAVRVGSRVCVSGTTATDDDGEIVGVGDPHAQTRQALENVENALQEAGATIEDVVRTRIYVTDIENWEVIGEAHGAVFGDVRPATSMVEVSRLIEPELLVEIEADALIDTE